MQRISEALAEAGLRDPLANLTISPPSTPTLTDEPEKCPKCEGTGKAWGTFGNELRWFWCSCEAGDAGKFKQYRKISELPPRFWDAKLSDFPTEVQKLVEPALEEYHGLIIHGPVGSGKSHLAGACLNELAEGDIDGLLFVSVPEMLERIRATYNSDKTDDLFERALKADWLVLDDFGTERVTPWVQERQYMLINRRYNYRLATICTTNLQPSALAKHIGDRAASRLMEMCEIVKLTGKDRRLKGAV